MMEVVDPCVTCTCSLFKCTHVLLGQISKVSQVSSDGYFRPESPWLPGTRKVEFNTEPVRLTSFSNQSANDPKAPVIRINNLTASWSNDAEKTVLKGISFDLDSVSARSV